MRLEDLQKHEGEVIILDLINGAQVTAELKEIQPGDEGSGKHWAIIDTPLIFQVTAEPKDVRQAPHPTKNPVEHKVRHGSYGHPLFDMGRATPIDLDHILMAHECHPDMARVYQHTISGIEIAPAGALDAMDAVRTGKIQLP